VRVGTEHAILAAALLLAAGLAAPRPAGADGRAGHGGTAPAAADTLTDRRPETLQFAPAPEDTLPPDSEERAPELETSEDEWLSTPFGEHLLTEPEAWHVKRGRCGKADMTIDYNRVDALRLGVEGQVQDPATMAPRLGARAEYAVDRERLLYGVQLEQPLLPHGRLGFGVSMSRATEHYDLQQVGDIENSLALAFARQDYRDYFEREGFGAYAAWRVPDFSVVSLHVRNDTYRSLPLRPHTGSLFLRGRDLRDNPPVDEGDIHAVILRLARQVKRSDRARAGLYHWIELERAGAGLGGDFSYTRGLADVRSVLRLSPVTTLVVRGAAGCTPAGTLPAQKVFTAGGVDGLRAHALGEFRGNQLLLGQAEYSAGLWRPHAGGFQPGVHVLAFVDAGRAWDNPRHGWDPARQHLQVDGGFGVGNGDDFRVYVARNLQRPRSKAVFSVRLQRPF